MEAQKLDPYSLQPSSDQAQENVVQGQLSVQQRLKRPQNPFQQRQAPQKFQAIGVGKD